MKGRERLKELINQAKKRGITKKRVARGVEISSQHLSNLLNGHNEWKLSQIEKLCAVLGITLAEAFLDPGEDMELMVLLQKILDAGPEPYHAIAWNIHGISKQIALSGPKLTNLKKRAPAPRKKA